MQAPASEIRDKISFIINNLSAANIEAKAKELTEILKEQYYPWFAQYMVMKRLEISRSLFRGVHAYANHEKWFVFLLSDILVLLIYFLFLFLSPHT